MSSPDRRELLEEAKSILIGWMKRVVDDPRAFGTKLDVGEIRIDDIERRMTDDEAVGA